MRRKHLFAFLILGLTSISISGCDKFVQAAVVSETEEGSLNAAVHDYADEGRTVSEQVAGPERYEAWIQETRTVKAESGQEIEQQIRIMADTAIDVPDVDTIRPKKTVTTICTDEEFRNMTAALSGNEISAGSMGANQYGEITVNQIPYEYSSVIGPADYQGPGVTDMGYYMWQMCWADVVSEADQYYNRETGEVIAFEKQKNQEIYRTMAEEYLEEMEITDFRYANMYEMDHSRLFGQDPGQVNAAFVEFERIVDGVPVTYTSGLAYPSYQIGSEKSSYGYYGANRWYDETVTFSFVGGKLEQFMHNFPILIEDASDESLFLLPFEEIRQIFENTLPEMFAGKMLDDELIYNIEYNGRPAVTQYPVEIREDIAVCIEEVKLGYLLMKKDHDTKEGELIPVWDFIGTWTAQSTGEDGKEVVEIMDAKKVSLLTVNACDGTIIQRTNSF